MSFLTDLRLVFRAIGDRRRDFNWLITELHCICLDRDKSEWPGFFLDPGPHWISGVELTRLVDLFNMQFIWAVLSGFRPGVVIDPHNLDPYPYADGNRDFWELLSNVVDGRVLRRRTSRLFLR